MFIGYIFLMVQFKTISRVSHLYRTAQNVHTVIDQNCRNTTIGCLVFASEWPSTKHLPNILCCPSADETGASFPQEGGACAADFIGCT